MLDEKNDLVYYSNVFVGPFPSGFGMADTLEDVTLGWHFPFLEKICTYFRPPQRVFFVGGTGWGRCNTK